MSKSISSSATIRNSVGYYDPSSKMAFIHLLLHDASGAIPGKNTMIASVPSEYAPSDTIGGFAFATPSGSTGWQGFELESCSIDTSGIIKLANYISGKDYYKMLCLFLFYKVK